MIFLALHAHRSVSMCRSDLKSSPAAGSPFNSEQDRVVLLYPVATNHIRSAQGRSFAKQVEGLNRLKLLKVPSKSLNFRFLLGFDKLSR